MRRYAGSQPLVRARAVATVRPVAPELFDPEHLVGAEIAERLGAAHAETVHNWRRRYPGFPQPAASLKQTLIRSWPDVEAWPRATGRLE